MIKYRKEIDGLRALAILPVILFHAGVQGFSGGFVGVDVFFVISGYLITSIILSDERKGRFSIVKFYERRARRILPALFLVMSLCLPAAWFLLLPSDLVDFSQSLIGVSLFSSNFLFWKESGYFAGSVDMKPLLHTWSLAVEEQYYVLFPLLFVFLWRFARKRLGQVFFVLLIISLAVAEHGAHRFAEANFYLLPTRGWELLIGALVALYLAKKRPSQQNTAFAQKVSLIGAGLVLLAVFAIDKTTPFPGLYALLPTLGTACLIVFALPETTVGKLLSRRTPVLIGKISYSAYLWHQPLFAFARHSSADDPEVSVMLTLSCLSFLLAYASWRLVETPFRDVRVFNRKQVFTMAAIGSLFFICVGSVGWLAKGFPERYSPEDLPIAAFDMDAAKEYVPIRYQEHALAAFDQPGKLKVLIVGDSYGEDLVNALYEAGLADKLQFSTYRISAVCGNIRTDKDFSFEIDKVSRVKCARVNYNDKKLIARIKEADAVWLASSWRKWQIKYLPETVENIRKMTKVPVVIFGRKNFGGVRMDKIMKVPPEFRHDIKNKLSITQVEVNDEMKKTLTPMSLSTCPTCYAGRDRIAGFSRMRGNSFHLTAGI